MLFKLNISIFKNIKVIAVKISTAVYFNTFLFKDRNVNIFNKLINIFIVYRFAFFVIKNDETIKLLRLKFNNCKIKIFKN